MGSWAGPRGREKAAGSLFKIFFKFKFHAAGSLGVETPGDGFNLQAWNVVRFSAGVWRSWVTGGHVLRLTFSIDLLEPGR